MKIAVLTSTRSDYGNYRQLLKALKKDIFFDVTIIVFGTHLSHNHGFTVKNIYDDGYFNSIIEKNIIPEGDTPFSICKTMSKVIAGLAPIWRDNFYDLVFCLGDRYEMFAACACIVPYNLKLAHISGGEQTLGAIDDVFRHSITHMSTYHFTTTEDYRQRVVNLKGSDKNVYNTGSLNIDNLVNTKLLSKEEFKKQFGIDINLPSILITFHPETISYKKNEVYIHELISALNEIHGYQLIITMPNADTMGNMIRDKLKAFISSNKHVIGVESFGSLGYFTCMKYCSFMLGNTSSGFVEAAFFSKYVINIGNRQNGRINNNNIINCEINAKKILAAVKNYKNYNLVQNSKIYGDGNSARQIIQIIKNAKLE